MYVAKNFHIRNLLRFSGVHIVWLSLWAGLVATLYTFFTFKWMQMPWLPVSVLGTAVAFYIGFKNNSAYDRLWEARKIWGAIVNSSRMIGASVKGYVGNYFRMDSLPDAEIHAIHQRLIYRHIAWLYTLRSQLLIPTSWEHLGRDHFAKGYFEMRKKQYGVGLFSDKVTENGLENFLSDEERERVIMFQNTATQLIDNQSQDLMKLREDDLIDDFRHMELQKLMNELYTHQGKCERIKKFPLPRQYASSSFIFVCIFIFLLPFGVIPAFQAIDPEIGQWIAMPFVILLGWVYVMMELIGDYSENPFEGLGNDIPMLALCRTIEIDLREMLGETELPPKIEPVNNVLM
ncbi:MAG: bestrophin family ion channel [Bacteroidota bacterium]